jgi:hypothetical protein
MMEAQKSQMMSGPGAMRGGRGGPMMRGVGGGRPGPYDRMAGPQMGRGYGAYGPAAIRGSRNVKSEFFLKLGEIFLCVFETGNQ